MALLQIAEPGQSSAPHQHKLAAGIDLGTTNSLVASVRSGTASTLLDSQERSILPSVVNYGADETLVGYPAREQAETDPHNTVISVKRLLGRSLQDINQRYPHLPYRFKASEKGLPIVQTAQGDKNPIQISAGYFESFSRTRHRYFGRRFSGCGHHCSCVFR